MMTEGIALCFQYYLHYLMSFINSKVELVLTNCIFLNALSNCFMKWFFSSESDNINLHEITIFCYGALGLYRNNHSNLMI